MSHPVEAADVSVALSFIPANLPRDEWVRVAMAIKSEFPGPEGFELFDSWSRSADGAYDARSVRDTWRSVKAGGGVKIGTLLQLAKSHGYVRAERPRSAVVTPDRAVAAVDDEAARLAAQEAAAGRAAELWANAQEPQDLPPYLVHKGVQAYGVRSDAAGRVLVPARDAEGKLWNVQTIAVKPRGGSVKLFLKGGRKAGLWHWLGDALQPRTVLICEGYATGATLHEATELPVVVAFDAGNLKTVARSLRHLHAAAQLVVCGDDDQETAARTGVNPGMVKAQAAADACDGLAVFPVGLEGGGDFNDLHVAQGLPAVRRTVFDAIAAATKPAVSQAGGDSATRNGLDLFEVNADGVWFHGADQDGKRRKPDWVCSRLEVAARTRDQDGNGWGYLLTFDDPIGRPRQWAMPARMLAGDGNEYRQILLNMGLRISSASRARNLLTHYIQNSDPDALAICTDRAGWHGAAFVMPHETIGDGDERIVFQTDSAVENTFRVRGGLVQWREGIGALCTGNSRLLFAVCCALAGPLLRPAGVESGGFHLRGDSSSGKTTALRLAASVYGGPSYLQRWRTTDNALEAIAAQHCDCTLILDELAQVDPKQAGECAYMLANEQAKARATRTGAPRTRLSWRLLFLSAGELGLADHMAEGAKRARAGQEVRMADIPVDAGVGLGAFEHLHGFANGSAFARHLASQAQVFHGSLGRMWLEWLCANADTLKRAVRERMAAIHGRYVPENASGQVERVGGRFALVAAAGELATAAGLTGWQPGEAERGVLACYRSWVAARGGTGNSEVVAILRQVRRFLEQHAEGRFSMWHRGADDHAPKTLHRAGVRRMLNAYGEPIKTNSQHLAEFGDRMPVAVGEAVTFEFFVFPETFKAEVCQGFDYKAVCKVLVDHGCLHVEEAGRFNVKANVPGVGPGRYFRIKPEIFELDI